MRRALGAAGVCALAAAAAIAGGSGTATAARSATTTLLSRTPGGATPNGASTNAVISTDLRYAQIVAFESAASNLVSGDTNGLKDVYAIRRAGSFGDNGSAWRPGTTQLVSRGVGGEPANGPSFEPAVDGSVSHRATCVAFLSDASNLVDGDTNGVTDAFLAKAPNFVPQRVSLPGDAEAPAATTGVAVSGDCSRTAFVTAGNLYVRTGSNTKQLDSSGTASDPSFAVGETNDLVFATSKGVFLSASASSNPSLVAAGGRNPAYCSRKRGGSQRRFVAYERSRGGHVQIAFRQIGGGERIATKYGGKLGNGDSRDPTVVNAGFNIGFETKANNLPIKSSGERGDNNHVADAYVFTNTGRAVTIIESVNSSKDLFKTGGRRPSTSYYRNYVVFDSAGNNTKARRQIYMRYLGGI
jgi:hypothetical protein